MLCGGGDRRAEHGSAGRTRLGAACDPDSERAAPRAETALRVQGDPPDGLCLEGARREARTLTWRPGDGSAVARVSTRRLPGRCRRSRAEDRRLPQSQRHKSGPSAPPRETPEEGRLQAREAARRSVARRHGGVGLDHAWRPGRRVIESAIRATACCSRLPPMPSLPTRTANSATTATVRRMAPRQPVGMTVFPEPTGLTAVLPREERPCGRGAST